MRDFESEEQTINTNEEKYIETQRTQGHHQTYQDRHVGIPERDEEKKVAEKYIWNYNNQNFSNLIKIYSSTTDF